MTSATLITFETAIGLAKQAVHQDKAKNYSEAARCYREAISTFNVVKSKSGNVAVSRAIDEKITQYRQRLARIDKYLLSKADLSQLFKSVVIDQQQSLLQNDKGDTPGENSTDQQDSHQTNCIDEGEHRDENILKRGLAAIEKAKRRDAQRNYTDALKFYEQGMADLLAVAVDKQEYCPENAEVIKFKCLLIHDRVNAICDHLESGVPLPDRKDSSLEIIKDESNEAYDNHGRRHHSGNSNGFDSCSASPEPLLNTSNPSYNANPTSIAEEYEDDSEDNLLLMDEVRSNLSLASIPSAFTAQTPVKFVPMEIETFQKAASEAGSRHSLYPMCEIKRSPSLASGHSDIDLLNGKPDFSVLNGKIALGEKARNTIPLADLDQELCISYVSLQDDGIGGVDRLYGTKSTSMLSSASSCNSLTKHKYRSLHSSAEDVLAAYAASTPESIKNYSYSEKDRNVSELTYVNTAFDPVAYQELCLNDSEGSDSGISSDPSPKNSARVTSSTSTTPTMNANNVIKISEEELRDGAEEVISRTLSEHSLCQSEGENKPMLLTVASVYATEYSQENNNTESDTSRVQKEEASIEKTQPTTPPGTPTTSSQIINATSSESPILELESTPPKSASDKPEKGEPPKLNTPSPPLSRGGSTSSKKSQLVRPEEDELTVLSAEEVIEVDGIPLQQIKPRVKELQIKDAEVYGRARPEYVPPRAFARRPQEDDDEEGLNKGCYYFMACLDAFWIL